MNTHYDYMYLGMGLTHAECPVFHVRGVSQFQLG